jgi:hypothetical protein
VYEFAGDSATVNLDRLRARLRKMSDEELRKFGKAAANPPEAAVLLTSLNSKMPQDFENQNHEFNAQPYGDDDLD